MKLSMMTLSLAIKNVTLSILALVARVSFKLGDLYMLESGYTEFHIS